jgi:hypothetical protein
MSSCSQGLVGNLSEVDLMSGDCRCATADRTRCFSAVNSAVLFVGSEQAGISLTSSELDPVGQAMRRIESSLSQTMAMNEVDGHSGSDDSEASWKG